MKLNSLSFIEVANLKGQWAISIDDCKQEMKPIIPKYVSVNNHINSDSINIDNFLTDTIPVKIIDGLTGGISDNYIEVGFWKLKLTNNKK